jgi:hypothetical protein
VTTSLNCACVAVIGIPSRPGDTIPVARQMGTTNARHKGSGKRFILEPEQRIWLPFRFASDGSFRAARNTGTPTKNAPGKVPGA